MTPDHRGSRAGADPSVAAARCPRDRRGQAGGDDGSWPPARVPQNVENNPMHSSRGGAAWLPFEVQINRCLLRSAPSPALAWGKAANAVARRFRLRRDFRPMRRQTSRQSPSGAPTPPSPAEAKRSFAGCGRGSGRTMLADGNDGWHGFDAPLADHLASLTKLRDLAA